MDSSEQARRLYEHFLTPGPGDPPHDPADLGDPTDYDGEARHVVRRLQAGESADAVYDDLSRELGDAIVQAGAPATANPLSAALTQRWDLMGIGDLLKPPKKPQYLITDMIRRPALVCVYGAPGDLKSMLLMDLAVCVAGGQPWMEPLPDVGKGGSYQVENGPVLWLDLDNGPDRLQERFGALCRSRHLDVAPLHAISLPRPVYDASDPQEAELLSAQLRELGAVCCIVDNLGTVSGGRDENSSDMVSVMANLRWAAQDAGVTLFLIHHARKGQAGANGSRDGDSLRGHSSIEASLDLALRVDREGDDLTVRSTKTRDDPVHPFLVRWAFDRTQDGALDTARFWHLQRVQPKMPAYAEVATHLVDILNDLPNPPNQSELVRAIAENLLAKRDTALKAIRYAVTNKWIREEQGAGATSPKQYHVA